MRQLGRTGELDDDIMRRLDAILYTIEWTWVNKMEGYNELVSVRNLFSRLANLPLPDDVDEVDELKRRCRGLYLRLERRPQADPAGRP